MKFEYQRNESIPSLSWLAVINKMGKSVRERLLIIQKSYNLKV